MAKDENHLFMILAIIAGITCCNTFIVAAGTPGMIIDKKKYLRPDGGFLAVSDVSKNIMIIVCFLSIPLIIGFFFFYTSIKKSMSSDGGDDDDDE